MEDRRRGRRREVVGVLGQVGRSIGVRHARSVPAPLPSIPGSWHRWSREGRGLRI